MSQGTMTLSEAAEVGKTTAEYLAREAYEGRLKLHGLPACSVCGAVHGHPCEPTCKNAGTQIVWLGDWFYWLNGEDSRVR